MGLVAYSKIHSSTAIASGPLRGRGSNHNSISLKITLETRGRTGTKKGKERSRVIFIGVFAEGF
jgi:hypothetical protein